MSHTLQAGRNFYEVDFKSRIGDSICPLHFIGSAHIGRLRKRWANHRFERHTNADTNTNTGHGCFANTYTHCNADTNGNTNTNTNANGYTYSESDGDSHASTDRDADPNTGTSQRSCFTEHSVRTFRDNANFCCYRFRHARELERQRCNRRQLKYGTD
jgi:hypothetical protein